MVHLTVGLSNEFMACPLVRVKLNQKSEKHEEWKESLVLRQIVSGVCWRCPALTCNVLVSVFLYSAFGAGAAVELRGRCAVFCLWWGVRGGQTHRIFRLTRFSRRQTEKKEFMQVCLVRVQWFWLPEVFSRLIPNRPDHLSRWKLPSLDGQVCAIPQRLSDAEPIKIRSRQKS